MTAWHSDGKGVRALAVSGSRVALARGYGWPNDRVAVTRLGTGAHPATDYRPVLPSGQPLPSGTQVIGRGAHLHYLTGTDWYRLDVDDIPE